VVVWPENPTQRVRRLKGEPYQELDLVLFRSRDEGASRIIRRPPRIAEGWREPQSTGSDFYTYPSRSSVIRNCSIVSISTGSKRWTEFQQRRDAKWRKRVIRKPALHKNREIPTKNSIAEAVTRLDARCHSFEVQRTIDAVRFDREIPRQPDLRHDAHKVITGVRRIFGIHCYTLLPASS
jgi:hypothetical protein